MRAPQTVASFEPCYTTIPLPCDEAGRITFDALPTIREEVKKATAIALVDRAISVLSIIALGSIAYAISPKRRGLGVASAGGAPAG